MTGLFTISPVSPEAAGTGQEQDDLLLPHVGEGVVPLRSREPPQHPPGDPQ